MNLTYKKNGKTKLNKNAIIVFWTIIILMWMFALIGNRNINNKFNLVYEEMLENNKIEIGIVIKDGTTKEEINTIIKNLFKKYRGENIFIRIFDDSYYIGKDINYKVNNISLGFAKNYDDKIISIVEKNWSLKPSQEEYKLIVNIQKLMFKDFVEIEDDEKLDEEICNKLNINNDYLKELGKKYRVWYLDGWN